MKSENPTAPPSRRLQYFLRPSFLLMLTFLAVLAIIFWKYGHTFIPILTNRDMLQAYVAKLGWFGPLFIVALIILQTVVAPIPGQAVYLGSGYIYGALWGGIWGSIGMLLGCVFAMWVARIFGRPIVQRIIGERQMKRWSGLTSGKNTMAWVLILLSPIGDAPFLLAGLSEASYTKIAFLTLITRIPQVFVASAVGAGAVGLTWWQMFLATLVLAIPIGIFMRYQVQIMAAFERRISHYSARSTRHKGNN